MTSDTKVDPYSAYWAEVSDADLATAEATFADSPDWSLSADPWDLRAAANFVHIEYRGQRPRLYLATSAAAADAAADTVTTVLGRNPDSVG